MVRPTLEEVSPYFWKCQRSQHSHKEWKHKWREAIRLGIFAQVEKRRPNFAGNPQGLDRAASKLLYEATGVLQQRQHHLINIAVGACITEHTRAYGKDHHMQPCPGAKAHLRMIGTGIGFVHNGNRFVNYGWEHMTTTNDLCSYEDMAWLKQGVVSDFLPSYVVKFPAVADQCRTLRDEPVHLLPHPDMLPARLNTKPCRRWRGVHVEEHTPMLKELHTLDVGQHHIDSYELQVPEL